MEKIVYHSANPYHVFKSAATKTTQENAGYSIRPEINEVIEKSKADLEQAVYGFCPSEGKILDIGCGPGMYLQLFKESSLDLYATDINHSMLEEAQKIVPRANFIAGDFMDLPLNIKFNFIYCIGVLIYIPKQSIEEFFKKIHGKLEANGILYLNYPHAISWLDTVYNDLTYIQYSPKAIEKIIEPYFEIVKHEQAFDGRKVGAYDNKPYKSLNPNTDRTYKNSYLLIAQKK
ncbi:MAG: methyltransferase domain-containing protein [Bacteroidetes bacterium]|nr:methyltransferase domain-containing protein [Bacteroidota bacterium]